MKFKDFEQKLQGVSIITKAFLENFEDRMPYLYRLLSERKKKGWIIQLKKGAYIINTPHYIENLSPFFIANILYQPSYISMESALHYYGIIPEVSYQFTSISSKKTQRYENIFGTFAYHSITKKLFRGFEDKIFNNQLVFFAQVEKALLDFLYFKLPYLSSKTDIIEAFRFQNLQKINKRRLKSYAKKYQNKKLWNFTLQILNYHVSDHRI